MFDSQPVVTPPSPVLKTPTSSRRRTLFTPSPSSPLSPRPNHTSSMLPSPPRSPPDFLAPKRLFKPVPTTRINTEARNARRSLFLKKVQGGREDAAWKARGGDDEIMRMIFVAEQKRWAASLERAAAKIPTIYEEEEEERGGVFDEEGYPEGYFAMVPPPRHFNGVPECPEEFDEYLDRDGQELEEMLSQMDLDMDHSMITL